MIFFQIDGTGKMISAGAGDGTTSIVKLDESLINNSKLDRNNASDMFERFDFLCLINPIYPGLFEHI